MATPPHAPLPPAGIPVLSPSGILPPYTGNDPTVLASMSPYECSLLEMARIFCTSRVRVTIFRGLLEYRRGLAGLGFVAGFQWLSGSFLERIEQIENRDPRDVDVVTFCLPPAQCQSPADVNALMQANLDMFAPPIAKTRFHCDPYFVDLTYGPETIVSLTRYWFGLFSHRRGGVWKGLLQIQLSLSQDDSDAENYVSNLNYQ